MSWVRIHDGAMQNLKITALTDSAFRLWVRGLAYCQTALTDGLIPRTALKEMGAKRKDVEMLSTPVLPERAPLWEPHAIGFKVHNYLKWNDCRERVLERQAAAEAEKEATRERMKKWRDAKRSGAVTPHVTANVTPHVTANVTPPVTALLRSKPNQTEPNQTRERTSTGQQPLALGLSGRFKVWRWMLDEWIGRLGEQAEAFDIEAWLHELDKRDKLLIPANTNWKWLDGQWWEEATKRGLVASAGVVDPADAMWAEIARKGPSVRP